MLKTLGLVEVLRAALQRLRAQIEQAFVFGSVARQDDTAQSDVDLLVVSEDLACGELLAALEGAGQTLRRKVHPAICTSADLRTRRAVGNALIQRVMQQPKTWGIGQAEKDASSRCRRPMLWIS